MAGPILQSDTKVAWAARTNSPALARADRIDATPSAASSDPRSPRIILPLAEHRYADSSPSPFPTSSPLSGRDPHSQPRFPVSDDVTPLFSDSHERPADPDRLYIPGADNDGDSLRTPNLETMSAPAELHQQHRRITMDTPESRFSADMIPGYYDRELPSKVTTLSVPVHAHTDPLQPLSSTRQAIGEQRDQESHEFHLDKNAPIRALRHPPASASAGAAGQPGSPSMGTIEEHRGQSRTPEFPLKKAEAAEVKDEDELERVSFPGHEGANDRRTGDPQTWGEPFKLQWIKTERLQFYRTRHLRNPWNHDREIKVSRDGTELEPSVGQALLEEWDRVVGALPTEKQPQQSGQGGIVSGGNRHHGRSKGGAGGGTQKGKQEESRF